MSQTLFRFLERLWNHVLDFVSPLPPREVFCDCGDVYCPNPNCSLCMGTGKRPVVRRRVPLPKKSKETAYLVGFLDITVSPPVVRRVHVFSSNAYGLTSGFDEFPFDIVSMEGEDFQDAHQKLLRALKEMAPKHFYYDWIKPIFIPKGDLD